MRSWVKWTIGGAAAIAALGGGLVGFRKWKAGKAEKAADGAAADAPRDALQAGGAAAAAIAMTVVGADGDYSAPMRVSSTPPPRTRGKPLNAPPPPTLEQLRAGRAT